MAIGKAKNILLTGVPRVGKTTIVRKVIETGLPVAGGFYTEEIQEGGKRVGFAIKSLDGEEGVLAHVRSKSKFRVGKYGVEVESFEKIGVKSIREAIGKDGVIVMDEIGRMELFSECFRKAVIEALDSSNVVFGVIQIKRNPFLNAIRARDDTEVVTVTRRNRESLPAEIASRLRELIR